MNDDDETGERLKPLPFVRPPGKARPENDAKLPGLNDKYQAAGAAENSEVSRLVVVMGRDGFRPDATAYYFLQYVHMGIGKSGVTATGDQLFRVVFSDLQPMLLTVRGRNLLRICDYISLRRMPWIRQADRDFRPGDGGDNEPIITRIEVTDWKRPKGEAAEPARAMEEELA